MTTEGTKSNVISMEYYRTRNKYQNFVKAEEIKERHLRMWGKADKADMCRERIRAACVRARFDGHILKLSNEGGKVR